MLSPGLECGSSCSPLLFHCGLCSQAGTSYRWPGGGRVGEVRSWGRLCPNDPNPFCTFACPSPSDSPKWGKQHTGQRETTCISQVACKGQYTESQKSSGNSKSKEQLWPWPFNSRPPSPQFCHDFAKPPPTQPPQHFKTPIHLLKPTQNKLSPGIPQLLEKLRLWISSFLIPSCKWPRQEASTPSVSWGPVAGRMIKTLTMMIRRFPFKNQSLRRQANIVPELSTKENCQADTE